MSNNPSLNQQMQGGVETVYMTPLAATKRFMSMGVDFDPQFETDAYFPPGYMFPTSNAPIQEWSEGDLSGVLTYTEIVYPLSMLLGDATITTPAGGTNARKWTWAPAANALLTPKSFTLEKGNSVYGMRFPGCVLTGFNIGWSRTDRIEIGGSVMGGRIDKPFTLTTIASNATVSQIRVLPPQVDVYMDDTFATVTGLTPTQMPKAFEAGISLDGLYSAVWPLNSSLTNFDGIVPAQPDSESTLLLMVNATSMALIDTLRAGQRKYMKIRAFGATIETTIKYEFSVTLAVEIADVDAFEDSDGVYAVPITFQPVSDGTNPPITFEVVNTLLAL